MVKITVITVVFNGISTLERTIRSVIGQDYPDIEYIIIDGGSTDGTVDIIRKYDKFLSYWISEPDDGIYYAMNKGIVKVRDGFILFLNADDYLADDSALSRIAECIQEDETIYIGRVKYGERLSKIIKPKEQSSMYYDVFYPHQAMFIPRKLFSKIGLYDTNYKVSADFDWICRAMYKKCRINWIDELISCFALGGISASLQCVIDEYNISKKYMCITNDIYLDDMTSSTVEKSRTYFFRMMLRDDIYSDSFRLFFKEIGINDNSEVQIWGAGFWAELFIGILNKCGITVNTVFDRDRNKVSINGVSVVPYNKTSVKKLLISTEDYDTEISDILRKDGFIRNRDYLEFHSFRDEMLKYYNKEDEVYTSYVKQTGLDIL